MPTARRHPEPPDTQSLPRRDPSPPAPRKRRGGQELPDDVQDRPEQNAGYDEAVRSGPAGETRDLRDLDVVPEDGGARQRPGLVDDADPAAPADADDRAARDAANEVRRRERRNG